MVNKNLSEKIKITITSFGILSCLYFVIAVWLKSDGAHFNPSLAYELLKDTLTLGAAFLAPAAAFVLFTDWRIEYEEKKLAENMDNTLEGLIKIDMNIKMFLNHIGTNSGVDISALVSYENLVNIVEDEIKAVRVRISLIDMSGRDVFFENHKKLLFEMSSTIVRCKMGLFEYQKQSNNGASFIKATNYLLADSINTYWDKSEILFKHIQYGAFD